MIVLRAGWRRDPHTSARLAQLAERKALNLVVVGSSPTVGVRLCFRRRPTRCFANAVAPGRPRGWRTRRVRRTGRLSRPGVRVETQGSTTVRIARGQRRASVKQATAHSSATPDTIRRSACSVAASYKPPMLVTRVRLPAGAGCTHSCSCLRRIAAPCRENTRRATGLGWADKWRLALHNQPCCPRCRHFCCRYCACIAGSWGRSRGKA